MQRMLGGEEEEAMEAKTKTMSKGKNKREES